MPDNILFSHLTSAAIFAYVLQLLQRWEKLPWVTAHTAWVNIGLRALFSFAANVGIGWVWNGHLAWNTGASVTITIPGLAIVAHGLYHLMGQFGLQHGFLKILNAPDAPVAH